MLLGRVVGTVVSTQKERELEGLRFLMVRGMDVDGKPTSSLVVAVDSVGAGVGEVVLYAAGSSARQTKVTKDRPVDATIMAIVDQVVQVLDKAHDLLGEVAEQGIWSAIGHGVFADVKRTRSGGKGYAGVVPREPGYLNPILEVLEKGSAA